MTLDAIIAETLGISEAGLAAFPDGTPFFGPPLEMSSLSGALMLERIKTDLGVDIAATDLALDSLRSLGDLRRFVTESRATHGS
ncbi:MAG: phosphopantetheine-binding protein [Nocardioides sp.]